MDNVSCRFPRKHTRTRRHRLLLFVSAFAGWCEPFSLPFQHVATFLHSKISSENGLLLRWNPNITRVWLCWQTRYSQYHRRREGGRDSCVVVRVVNLWLLRHCYFWRFGCPCASFIWKRQVIKFSLSGPDEGATRVCVCVCVISSVIKKDEDGTSFTDCDVPTFDTCTCITWFVITMTGDLVECEGRRRGAAFQHVCVLSV